MQRAGRQQLIACGAWPGRVFMEPGANASDAHERLGFGRGGFALESFARGPVRPAWRTLVGCNAARPATAVDRSNSNLKSTTHPGCAPQN